MTSKKKNLKTAVQKKICIVGIGNPLRSDDGLGAYVCEHIEDINLPMLKKVIQLAAKSPGLAGVGAH